MFALAVVMALSSVEAPFVGQNWGAGNFSRMKDVVRFSNRFASAWGAGMCILLILLARPIAMIFSKDPEVISGIVLYLRIVPISYFSQGIFRLAIGVLNVIEMPFHAAGLGIAQVFILTLPLCWAGARFYGLSGVFLGIGLAYLVTGAVSYRVLSRGVEGIESRMAMPPEAR